MMAAFILALRSCMQKISSSTVDFETSLYTVTGFCGTVVRMIDTHETETRGRWELWRSRTVCPILWQRSSACKSLKGLKSKS